MGDLERERLVRVVAGLRLASGLVFAAAPRAAGGLLAGGDVASPGAELFVRAFGARDVLLGLGAWRALRAGLPWRPWLAACAAADAFDAAATLAGYRRLPAGRRALTLAVSLAPALLEAWLAAAEEG